MGRKASEVFEELRAELLKEFGEVFVIENLNWLRLDTIRRTGPGVTRRTIKTGNPTLRSLSSIANCFGYKVKIKLEKIKK